MAALGHRGLQGQCRLLTDRSRSAPSSSVPSAARIPKAPRAERGTCASRLETGIAQTAQVTEPASPCQRGRALNSASNTTPVAIATVSADSSATCATSIRMPRASACVKYNGSVPDHRSCACCTTAEIFPLPRKPASMRDTISTQNATARRLPQSIPS
jgi:hypothetical protein